MGSAEGEEEVGWWHNVGYPLLPMRVDLLKGRGKDSVGTCFAGQNPVRLESARVEIKILAS
jgi:hypothetical protein